MIEQFTLKAETTTDLVAKEVLQDYAEACRVALKERMEIYAEALKERMESNA